jgi:hypothetical protein
LKRASTILSRKSVTIERIDISAILAFGVPGQAERMPGCARPVLAGLFPAERTVCVALAAGGSDHVAEGHSGRW